MRYVSIPLREYPIEPSFRMCKDCVLFSTDYLNVFAADAALIASMVHNGTYTVGQIKDELNRSGVPIRL